MYVQFIEKLTINLRYDLATFLFENCCCGFLERVFVTNIELSTGEKDTWKWVETAELWTGLILKHEPGPKAQAQPDLIPTFIFEAQFRPWNPNLNEWVKICATD